MINYGELKTKLTNWVLEESATYSEFRAEDLELHLKVTWGYEIDVIVERVRPHTILCYSSWLFQYEQTKAFSKLTKKEKREFFYELEKGLTNFLVTVDIQPESRENIEIMHFYRRLFIEELTKTAFWDALMMMNRVKDFTRLFIVNKLGLDMEGPESLDEKPGVK